LGVLREESLQANLGHNTTINGMITCFRAYFDPHDLELQLEQGADER
jgi:hypothetical protein